MARFLLFLAGLGVLGYVAWVSITPKGDSPDAAPPQQLQNAKDAARRIEADWQQRADERLDPSKQGP